MIDGLCHQLAGSCRVRAGITAAAFVDGGESGEPTV